MESKPTKTGLYLNVPSKLRTFKNKTQMKNYKGNSQYWKQTESIASRCTYKCRECKKYIKKGSKIIQRDGRKIRLIYHAECFSGSSDPRT